MARTGVLVSPEQDRHSGVILADTVHELSTAVDLETITGIVAKAGRQLTGADGATFVLKDGDQCYYADEDALSPLWKGRRFTMDACISGWCMLNHQAVVIDDINEDSRVPQDVYRPTFVKSLCTVPIRPESPLGAIGNYWAKSYHPDREELQLLQVLANSAAIALENLTLKQQLLSSIQEQQDVIDRGKELEVALHSLAHDLRNPLGAMRLYAELIQSKLSGLIDRRDLADLDMIVTTCDRTMEQIQRMLMLFKVTEKTLEVAPMDLSAMAGEISEEIDRQDSRRAVEFRIQPGLMAEADPYLIRVVLENLISNAYKYSAKEDNPKIELGKMKDDGEELYFIRDNGAGFDPAKADRLFRPLSRLHADAEFSGAGLGLATVARIVKLHGGRVRAHGRPGEGAIFLFSLGSADGAKYGV